MEHKKWDREFVFQIIHKVFLDCLLLKTENTIVKQYLNV